MRLLGFLSVCTLFVIPLYIRYFEEASFSVFESYSFTLLVCVAIFINYVAFVDKAVKYVFVKVTTPEKKRLYDCVITFLTNKATFVAAFVSFGFHEVLLWTSYCLIMVVLRCTVSLARYRLSLIRGQPFAFTPLRTLRKLLGAVIAVAYINAALGYLLWTSVATWNVKLLLGYDVISLGVVLLRTVPGLIVQLVDQDWLKRERLVSQADMIGELFGFAVTYASFVHVSWSDQSDWFGSENDHLVLDCTRTRWRVYDHQSDAGCRSDGCVWQSEQARGRISRVCQHCAIDARLSHAHQQGADTRRSRRRLCHLSRNDERGC
jgi:hypothetical protein